MIGRRTTYELHGKVYEGPGARSKGAVVLGPGTVWDLGRKYGGEIPPAYFVATAAHESNFATNEVDYEPADARQNIFVSKGLYQIAEHEAAIAGFPDKRHGGDLLDPDFSTQVFAKMMTNGLEFITKTVRKLYGVNPHYPDIWGYLAVFHNEGALAVQKTLKLHGDDWVGPGGYAQRNAGRPIVRYGNDCITGGTWVADLMKQKLAREDLGLAA